MAAATFRKRITWKWGAHRGSQTQPLPKLWPPGGDFGKQYHGVKAPSMMQGVECCSTPKPNGQILDWVPETPETIPAATSSQGLPRHATPFDLDVVPDSPPIEEVRDPLPGTTIEVQHEDRRYAPFPILIPGIPASASRWVLSAE